MINLPEFDLYAFDLDDTLINTRQAYHSAQETAVSEVFPHLSGNELTDRLKDLKWLCGIFGSGQPENYFSAFVKSQPDAKTAMESAVSSLLDVYHSSFWKNLRCFEGAKSYLEKLYDRNKLLALVSNGKTKTQLEKLQQTGLEAFFPKSLCFISEMVLPAQKKPSPHMLELACLRSGVPASGTVYFGNIATDIIAGNLAGATTVFYGKDEAWMSSAPDIAHPDYRLLGWKG